MTREKRKGFTLHDGRFGSPEFRQMMAPVTSPKIPIITVRLSQNDSPNQIEAKQPPKRRNEKNPHIMEFRPIKCRIEYHTPSSQPIRVIGLPQVIPKELISSCPVIIS